MLIIRNNNKVYRINYFIDKENIISFILKDLQRIANNYERNPLRYYKPYPIRADKTIYIRAIILREVYNNNK